MPLVPTSGPYVAVATFCERVLQDSDKVLTVIRVVDRLTVTARGPDVPDELPPTPTNLTAAIVLRRGSARGRQAVKIRPEDPSGRHHPPAEVSLNLTGDEEAGSNIIVDFSGFAVDQEGLWWFDVLFGDAELLLARIPLRVMYQPQRTPADAE